VTQRSIGVVLFQFSNIVALKALTIWQ